MSEPLSPTGQTPTGAPQAGATPSPPPGPPPRSGFSGADGFFDSVRHSGITRSDDRWIGGVCSGFADRLGIDPLVVRAILFVSVFFVGAGFALYGLAWALLPERSDGRIHLQEAFHGNFDVAMLGAIGFFVVGMSRLNGWFSWWNYWNLGWLNGLLWLAAIAITVVVCVNLYRNRDKGSSTPATGSPMAPANAAYRTAGATGAPAGVTYPAPGPAAEAPRRDTSWRGWQAAPPPPKPPRPPKPHRQRRGPGAITTGIVIGLSFLAAAVLLFVDRETDLDVRAALSWLGVSIALAGLGIVISGLRGRTGGVLSFLAVVGLLFGLPAVAWHSGDWSAATTRVASGDITVATDATVAEKGYSVGAGDQTIDLSGLDLSTATSADPVTVPIQQGAGRLQIVIPRDAATQADVRVLAGQARWDVDTPSESNGTIHDTFRTDDVTAGTKPILILKVDLGAGQVTMTEAS